MDTVSADGHNKAFTTKRLYTNLVYEMEWWFGGLLVLQHGASPPGASYTTSKGLAGAWMGWSSPNNPVDGPNFGLFIKTHPKNADKPGGIQHSTIEVQLCHDQVSIAAPSGGNIWDSIRFKGQTGTSYGGGGSPAAGQRCYRPGALYDLYPLKFDNAKATGTAYNTITKPDNNYLIGDNAWHKITVIVNKDRLRMYLFNGNAPSYGERLAHDLSTLGTDFKNRINGSTYAGKLADYIGHASFVSSGALLGGRMAIQPGNSAGAIYIRDVRIREL